MIDQNIKELHHAMNEQRLCVFVGAGVSKSSETEGIKLPSWEDLIKSFQVELELPNEQDYLKLAQLYYLQFGEFLYYKKLKSFFNLESSPSFVHQLILKLNPQHIITTNWDCLLEKSISQNLDLFDVIVSDEDLSKSSLPRKLVKMHGDFEHHNIVFKEDDYLNYENNYPLISNYIKGILSTNAVLFMGYSYNDIDLKLIMRWLRNHAKSRQPMYLLVFNENKSQIRYLENQGIHVVVLPEIKRNLERLDSYSSRVADFLLNVLNFGKSVPESVNDYTLPIYNKIKHLADYKYVLYEQVSTSLGNCGYIHGEGVTLLQFYKDILTYDFDKSLRLTYQQFVENLKSFSNRDGDCELEFDLNKLDEILSILGKAGISGISLSHDTDNCQYIRTNENAYDSEFENLLSFEFDNVQPSLDDLNDLMLCAFKLYLKEKYKESVKLFEIALRLAISKKIYTKVLIASSNYQDLKSIINAENNEFNSNGDGDSNYRSFNDFYNSLPYEDKFNCLQLYKTLSPSYLKERSFDVFSSLRKAENNRSTIISGGFFFDKDSERSRRNHINMLHYFLGNNITIQHFREFRDINKYYIESSFNSQCKKLKIEIVKEEIYALIKYFQSKEIIALVNKFGINDGKYYDFIDVSEDNVEWITITLLPNLIKCRESSHKINSRFEGYIENVIQISSFIKFKSEHFNKILDCINLVINSTGVSIGFYEAVNRFFSIQYLLFKTDFDKDIFRTTIELIVKKFSLGKANGYERIAIQNNYINNFYGFAKENNIEITNRKDVERLIFEIKSTSVDNQCQLVSSLFISIYGISNIEIKETIDEYMSQLGVNVSSKPTLDGVIYYLTLVSNDFEKYEKDSLVILRKFLENNRGNISEIDRASKIEPLINYLTIDKGFSGYKDVYEQYFEKNTKSDEVGNIVS
ncbi:SIR2 family protein [Shewanella algae]|uniref:SIR2 family protein n=1 Tax=Shewanella algae TaxID=38313 RepID=UPI001AAF4E35|nr:SIR2 family protein [Shewanella algae]MBO2633251.1 SIR2 family protein [Shewanella algae]